MAVEAGIDRFGADVVDVGAVLGGATPEITWERESTTFGDGRKWAAAGGISGDPGGLLSGSEEFDIACSSTPLP